MVFKKYTNEQLIQYLIDYYNEFGKVPTSRGIGKAKGYPGPTVYRLRFNSFNNALEIAGLDVNKHYLGNKPNICEICGSVKTCGSWFEKSGLKVCYKCHLSDRNYFHGQTIPNSNLGIGIITEHIVYNVLEDCIKCNTVDHMFSRYDLISEKYGTINVKSSKLHKDDRWVFQKSKRPTDPDYYVCIGFDENRTEILYVWVIPGDSQIVTKNGIYLRPNSVSRAIKYQVDSTPYNKVYQNLDITTLPEFRNIGDNSENIRCSILL